MVHQQHIDGDAVGSSTDNQAHVVHAQGPRDFKAPARTGVEAAPGTQRGRQRPSLPKAPSLPQSFPTHARENLRVVPQVRASEGELWRAMVNAQPPPEGDALGIVHDGVVDCGEGKEEVVVQGGWCRERGCC